MYKTILILTRFCQIFIQFLSFSAYFIRGGNGDIPSDYSLPSQTLFAHCAMHCMHVSYTLNDTLCVVFFVIMKHEVLVTQYKGII